MVAGGRRLDPDVKLRFEAPGIAGFQMGCPFQLIESESRHPDRQRGRGRLSVAIRYTVPGSVRKPLVDARAKRAQPIPVNRNYC
jgi:hypothetical protein